MQCRGTAHDALCGMYTLIYACARNHTNSQIISKYMQLFLLNITMFYSDGGRFGQI